MQKTLSDDSSIARPGDVLEKTDPKVTHGPAEDSAGVKFMREVTARAKMIYPDHSESRTKYIEEKAAEEITRWVKAYDDLTEATKPRGPLKFGG